MRLSANLICKNNGPLFARFHTRKMLPNGLWESQLVHCSLLKHPYGRPWICFFLGWKSLQEAHSWEMLLSCLDLLRTTLQFQVAAKRCYAAGPDPCNVLGVSALARVATHPKQLVWSNSEVGQGNPKLCFSVFLISQKKNDASKNSTIFVEKSTTLFKTLPILFLVAPSNNLPFALMFYRIECSSSSCQHITPASFGGVRSHRRDENA